MIDENLRLDNYDYILNKKSIANYPCEKRDESKLLVYKNRKINSVKFLDILNYIPNKSTIILNDSRVINSRFFFFIVTLLLCHALEQRVIIFLI